jgi:hypothetical protein
MQIVLRIRSFSQVFPLQFDKRERDAITNVDDSPWTSPSAFQFDPAALQERRGSVSRSYGCQTTDTPFVMLMPVPHGPPLLR